MMVDNPSVIREIVKETEAHPTDESVEKMISDPVFMKQLDELAENFTAYAEKAWKEEFHEEVNFEMSKG